jgi:hypothetical protein
LLCNCHTYTPGFCFRAAERGGGKGFFAVVAASTGDHGGVLFTQGGDAEFQCLLLLSKRLLVPPERMQRHADAVPAGSDVGVLLT